MKHLELTEELLENASLYACGAMVEDERKQYAHHLEDEGCDVCRAEVRNLQAAMHALALDLPESTPSPAVKMRLMAQAELSASMRGLQNRQQPRGIDTRSHSIDTRERSFEWLAWLIAAAATCAVIAVLFLNSNLRSKVETLRAQLQGLEKQSQDQRSTLETVTSPRARVLNLSGQGTAPQAAARIFWNESQHQWLLYVRALPPVSKDKSYQLWFVPKTGSPVSAQVFNTNADGTGTFEIAVPASIGELKAAAVTTEPAGGLPQPSGSFVLLGAL